MQWMQANQLTNWRTDVGTSQHRHLRQARAVGEKVRRRRCARCSTRAARRRPTRSSSATRTTSRFGKSATSRMRPSPARRIASTPCCRACAASSRPRPSCTWASRPRSTSCRCNNEPGSGSQCEGKADGDVWFLDMAKASGWNFNYVSFHYYPRVHDVGFWMDKYLGQATRGVEEVRRAGIFQ